ncbi:MAG: N-acetylneuraminate synthase family protein [bacterium]
MHTFVIAEIGINHNGDINIAKSLIDGAVAAGCDAVKFQKRTIDIVYSKEQLDAPRESPWGTTQREQKEGLEFGKEEYDQIDQYCKEKDIHWLASAWDLPSKHFLRQYDLKYNKIASPMLTNRELLEFVAEERKYTFLSTGMSTMEEIENAVNIFRNAGCPFELMHCNSTYPMKNEDANLAVMNTLREYFGCKVGYSGHETGRIVSIAAVAMGATSIERHITLDRAMYGSDQAASIDLFDLKLLVSDIRTVEAAIGIGEKRVLETEISIKKKLRKN